MDSPMAGKEAKTEAVEVGGRIDWEEAIVSARVEGRCV